MAIFRKKIEKESEDILPKERVPEENFKKSGQELESKELSKFEKESFSTSVPLFVKVDKYKEIITTLQEIKTLLSGLGSLFSVLEEIEQVKSDAINTLRITLQRVEKNIMQLDANFLKTSDTEVEKIKESIRPKIVEATELEDSLKQLYEELNAMKSEIEKMRGF